MAWHGDGVCGVQLRTAVPDCGLGGGGRRHQAGAIRHCRLRKSERDGERTAPLTTTDNFQQQRPRCCAVSLLTSPDCFLVRLLQVLPAGEVGELLMKSPLVMSHYHNKPVKSAEALVEVEGTMMWLHARRPTAYCPHDHACARLHV